MENLSSGDFGGEAGHGGGGGHRAGSHKGGERKANQNSWKYEFGVFYSGFCIIAP